MSAGEKVGVEERPNIVVGKSWPRAATPCDLIPKWEGEFCSYVDWVNFASKRLTVARSTVTGAQVPAICVDAFGRRCTCGGDMKRADEEGAFPVRYFFECEPAARTGSAEQ
jgi:hypothetical protein